MRAAAGGSSRRRRSPVASWLAIAALIVAAVPLAAAAPPPDSATAFDADRRARHLRELKTIERDVILAGASSRRARHEGIVRLLRRGLPVPEPLRPMAKQPARDFGEAGGPQGADPSLGRSLAVPREGGPFNQIVNDRSQDVTPGTTQSEVSIGVLGKNMLVAWNDGKSLLSGVSGMGYAYSTDGGASWTDGGEPPLGGGVVLWYSDPLVVVNERLGEFYFGGLALTQKLANAIGVVRGRFNGTQLLWDLPVVVRGPRDTLPDKPWLAVDSLSGNLYITYTTFFGTGRDAADQIEFQRSLDGNLTWSPPLKLSDGFDHGLVQGSRPVVGPNGELHVAWRAADTTLASEGRSALRVRSSRNGGASFGRQADIVRFFPNVGSGAPGFNRGFGIELPALAVDRGGSPWRGRTYAIWSEGLNVFGDVPPDEEDRMEVEPNGSPGTAIPITIGEVVRGDLSTPQDQDWFSFAGTADRTIVFYADSLNDTLDATLRLVCTDGSTRLAFSAPSRSRRRFVSYTLPTDGIYYLRLAPMLGTRGGYRLRSTWHEPAPGRARDHRDVFSAWSDDGATWSEPVRVNDGPGHFDDVLPEIAVAGDGSVYAIWYDFRDSPASTCGGESQVYLARSSDGGGSWTSLGPVTDVGTNWTDVFSNLSPNQGDYLGLFADDLGVYPCWADGRNGDPDAYMAIYPLASTPVLVSFADADARPDRVVVRWSAPTLAGQTVTIERRPEGEEWSAVGEASVSGAGAISFTDVSVEAGRRYGYRVRFGSGPGMGTAAEIWIDVPAAAPLALSIERVTPNPTRGPIEVSVVLPGAGPASLELLDVRGRRVAVRPLIAQAGRQVVRLDGSPRLAAGLYWVRVRQSGASASMRVAIVR